MALFKTFYVVSGTKEEKIRLVVKTIDILSVESWEFDKKGFTKVRMNSGDDFVIRCEYESFSDIVHAFSDAFGNLYTFSNN